MEENKQREGSFSRGLAGRSSPISSRTPLGITKREAGDYRRYYRLQARKRAGRRLPRDLRCPQCKLIKLNPRQWVRTGICRVCYNENKRGRKSVDTNVFTKVEIIRYAVDGQKLRRLRQDLGLTLKVMAHRIGWTHSWLCKLEVGDVIDIPEESYAKFQKFISEIGPP